MFSTKSLINTSSIATSLRSCSRLLTSPVLKEYQEIPTPKALPFIGTLLDYRNDRHTANRVMKRRFDELGNIYREFMFPGQPEQLLVCDPKDVETVFRADGEWPKRPVGGELFAKVLEEAKVKTLGLFIVQGEQWHKIRSPVSKFMMVPRKVGEYHEDFNKITLDLIKNIELRKNQDSSLLSDVPNLLFNWSFESVAYFMLGKRLGALDASGQSSPDTQEFIEATRSFFTDLIDLFFSLPLYRLYPTKTWKHVANLNRTVHTLARKFIDEKLAEIAEADRKALEAVSGEEEAPDKVDFVTYLVHSGKMSLEQVSVNVVDLLSAGVETTSYTFAWALYLLANNPEAQTKLRDEIQTVVGSEEVVTPAHINELNYLRNVFKETQRLYPLAVFNQRALQKDVVLSGYQVPKGTEVLLPQFVIGRMPEQFTEPDQFIPERWSKENKDKLPSSFAFLPFGFGPRMCVGRRVAELEMFIAMSHIVRSYQVNYDGPTLEPIMNMLLKPDKQLDLSFNKL